MNYITKKHVSRRHVLRGAGGVAIALPLLDAMLPAATAWAQTAAAPRPRYAAVYIPHGKTMEKWTPKAEGRDFEFTEILKPLEAHRERLNIISGLRLQTGYGTDGSATANETVEVALRVAGPLDARVHMLIVTDDDDAATEALGKAAGWAVEHGVMCETHRVSGNPGKVIVDFATELGADLVVVGDRGMHGVNRLLSGSVPNHVVHNAPCSVLLVDSTRRAEEHAH